MKPTCWASRLQPTASGGNDASDSSASSFHRRRNQGSATLIAALVRPKPNMARLTTSEPKCAQLPTAKRRMTAIWNAISAPATSAVAQ